MAEKAGQAAHRLEKPPIADQVHVVLWVIKANDIRFVNDQYHDKFDFVRQILNREGEFTWRYIHVKAFGDNFFYFSSL